MLTHPGGQSGLFCRTSVTTRLCLRNQRRYAEAEPFMLRALEYRSKVAGPPTPKCQRCLPTSLRHTATWRDRQIRSAMRFGRFRGSTKSSREVRSRFCPAATGACPTKLGRFADRNGIRSRHDRSRSGVAGKRDPQRVNVRMELGALRTGQEHYREAEQVFQSALEAGQSWPDRPPAGGLPYYPILDWSIANRHDIRKPSDYCSKPSNWRKRPAAREARSWARG